MGLSLALALVAFRCGADVAPEEALRRSLERRSSVNVDAIVEQIDPRSGGGTSKLRLWRDTAGRRRTEVLWPIAMQGRVFVDDGRTWTMVFPDTKSVKVRPSPLGEADDLEWRIRLVRRNYRLEIDAKATIAGRSTIRLVAKPRWDDLETQRFYLDAATYAPLRIDTLDALGGVSVKYVVRKISYPTRLDKETFEAPESPGMKREPMRPPQPLRDFEDAEKRAGFRPALPPRLPGGFRSQGMDLQTWRGIMPVAIRLTDGLVRINVYQFRIREDMPPPPADPDRVAQDVNGVRIEVKGDAPLAVREQILAAFAKRLAERS